MKRKNDFASLAVFGVVVIGLAAVVGYIMNQRGMVRPSSASLAITPVQTNNVKVTFDKFENRTTVSTNEPTPENMPLVKRNNSFVAQTDSTPTFIAFSYSFTGRSLFGAQGNVTVNTFGSDASQEDKFGRIDFLINGSIPIHCLGPDGHPGGSPTIGWLPISDLQSIANAQTVELKIGLTEYQMKSGQLKSLKEFLSQLGQ